MAPDKTDNLKSGLIVELEDYSPFESDFDVKYKEYLMKVYIENGKFYLNDNDNIVELSKVTKDSRGGEWLNLPENSCNRTYVSMSKLQKNQVIDYGSEIKEKRTLNLTGERKSTKKWYEYLTDEDKKIALKLIEKAEENRRKIENDPAEKIREQIRKLQERLEGLSK